MSASSSSWAIWSRRPRDPGNAPALIFSPKTNPPAHIYQLAFSDITPPPSPELSPSPELLTDIDNDNDKELTEKTNTPATTVPASPASIDASTSLPKEPAPPPPPPQKKSWASLLQPAASSSQAAGKKNLLPTSSIVGFSIPAASSPTPSSLISPSKKAALSSLLRTGTHDHSSDTQIRVRPRGLTNTGNMCFANSVLQVLLYCEPFWKLFMQLGDLLPSDDKSEMTALLRATADFIRDFLPPGDPAHSSKDSGKKNGSTSPRGKGKERERHVEEVEWDEAEAFIPSYVYDALKSKKRFDALMGGGLGNNNGYQGQEDAEEFLGFYLDTLEEELLALADSISPHGSTNGIKDIDAKIKAAQSVEQKVEDGPNETEDGWLEVGKKNRTVVTRTIKTVDSPISKIFGGKFRSTLRAPAQRDSVMIEDWRSLRVDIQAESIHTIEDALSHISHPQPVQMSHPVHPGTTIEASQQVLIDALPPVLVVHLKRFCYDVTVGGVMKVSKQVTFGEELIIPIDILSPTVRGQHRSRYKLFGVIYHHGISASGGHYTLDVLHTNRFTTPQNPWADRSQQTELSKNREGWIRIDDELVSDIRHADIFASAAFERDDAASRCAYMLFYKRIR
ncbi:hypothetical protein VNI00_005193 [Paramarasmius palmivorus]|uniref:Ubiquitin carboxyl-terminal hydrolase n=1 Tax=Paramarasmius palmivorus TaxID=297713 RepID=A0AAW0DEQ7_9AGAR